MKKAGITGGIGAGKTLVCKVFESLGVPVYYSDTRAKELMSSNKELKRQIWRIFGTTDRKELSRIVFSDPAALQKLNAMIHPEVYRDFHHWLKKREQFPYIIKEAAILFESGAYRGLDAVITVSAPVELRIARVMRRDGIGKEEIIKRMNAQMNEEDKIGMSAFVIRNDENNLVIPQVLEIHGKLSDSR